MHPIDAYGRPFGAALVVGWLVWIGWVLVRSCHEHKQWESIKHHQDVVEALRPYGWEKLDDDRT